MEIVVVLQDESGERLDEVADIHNHLHRVLPSEDDPSFPCLRYVDWYGDTVFNLPQSSQPLHELELLLNRTEIPEERELLKRIREMAKNCHDKAHHYVRFIGDGVNEFGSVRISV
jgi:hypothetical protein